jgi:hypothetical protein
MTAWLYPSATILRQTSQVLLFSYKVGKGAARQEAGSFVRYRVARRHGHERLPQLLFGPRLGLCHRRHAPVLGRLLTDLDCDAQVMGRIAPFDVRMPLRGLQTNAVRMPASICLPWCHRCILSDGATPPLLKQPLGRRYDIILVVYKQFHRKISLIELKIGYSA